VTIPLLELLGVTSELLPEDDAGAAACVRGLLDRAQTARAPVAAVIRSGTFGPMHQEKDDSAAAPLTRERAIELVVTALAEGSIVVSTTGKASRELYELRERAGQGHDRDFLMVGSMGHASQIALGLALGCPDRPVVCLDGDGAAIMHMGGLAVIGGSGAKNLRHVVLNNAAYDSVGGQPTPGQRLRLSDVALACRYPWARCVGDERALVQAAGEMVREPGPSMLEVRIRRGARSDLGRPHTSAEENLAALRRRLSRDA
jgi:phosphonopyruvate decarboxylase